MIMQTPLLAMSSLILNLIVYYLRLSAIFRNYMELNFHKIPVAQIAKFWLCR